MLLPLLPLPSSSNSGHNKQAKFVVPTKIEVRETEKKKK